MQLGKLGMRCWIQKIASVINKTEVILENMNIPFSKLSSSGLASTYDLLTQLLSGVASTFLNCIFFLSIIM